MSPFSSYLRTLRMRYGIRQADLAREMGYEQSYLSALEVGTKSPPTAEFVSKLISVLSLTDEERDALEVAVNESQKKYVIPADASEDVFRLYRELWESLDDLHPSQIQVMRDIVRFKKQFARDVSSVPRRIPRRRKEAA